MKLQKCIFKFNQYKPKPGNNAMNTSETIF